MNDLELHYFNKELEKIAFNPMMLRPFIGIAKTLAPKAYEAFRGAFKQARPFLKTMGPTVKMEQPPSKLGRALMIGGGVAYPAMEGMGAASKAGQGLSAPAASLPQTMNYNFV